MKTTHKKFAVLLLTATALLAGCTSKEYAVDSSAANSQALNFAWNADIGDLNPHLYAPSQWFAQAMVFEPLVQYGEGGKVLPALAETWDVSLDGKSYTFHLRKNVQFSDGSPFDAKIVKKNFDAVLANKEKHDWLELINEISSTEAVDTDTFRLNLKNPYYPVLQELALVRPLRFLGEAGFADDGTTAKGIKKPIGTGPWVLSEYKKDDHAVFTRNEHYWGTKPKLEKVTVKIIPDAESRVLAFQKGEVDLLFGSGQISTDSFKMLQDKGNYETKVSEPLATRVLAVNSNRGATKDLNVRQALEYGFDKKTLIDKVFYGYEKQADTLFSPNFPYCDLNLKPYGYDVEKAKQLLDAAGWRLPAGKSVREKEGQPLSLDLGYDSGDQVQKTIAEFTQGNLSKLGIQVNLIGEEYQTHVKRQMSGEFNLIFSETWGAPYDPHTVVGSMREPSHADYQAQAGLAMKKELDQQITRVLVTTEETERQNLYRSILTTLHEQAVYLPISYMENVAVARKQVTGVNFLPTQYEVPFSTIELK
ncbi:nickel ABC transporter substrate-binding protein [Tumebacillus flagellatus]|uniref:Nickel ABC transporter substrate-binding protein n=1 Tax=Tumebacillus flagellatus TaxID=1157490 RepID=A0A074LSR3_9BACL|nr:nickel ABC transporter substrate-binding protein [Tumebacillus flagellatus]KEO82853.1 nickel ABC transporter substrate-binding protein [Tumebacillus flagellatus]